MLTIPKDKEAPINHWSRTCCADYSSKTSPQDPLRSTRRQNSAHPTRSTPEVQRSPIGPAAHTPSSRTRQGVGELSSRFAGPRSFCRRGRARRRRRRAAGAYARRHEPPMRRERERETTEPQRATAAARDARRRLLLRVIRVMEREKERATRGLLPIHPPMRFPRRAWIC